jgi:Intracellular proteinase inhibitor
VLYSLLLAAVLVSDSMTLELSAPHEVPAGHPVAFAIHLINRGTAPLTVYLRGRPIAFDLIVTDARGIVVWRRLKGATTSMALQVRELPPGEALSFEDVWSQRTNAGALVKPGEYQVKGELLTDTDKPLETPVRSFRITH